MTDDVDKARANLRSFESTYQASVVLALTAIVDRLDRIAAVLERADEEEQP